MNITREWEAARYNDIYCHNKITTLQFCERCKHATPYKVDAVDFLKSSLDVSIKGEALISKNKFDCGNCGKSNNTVRQYLQCYELWIEGLGESITKIGTHQNIGT